MELRGILSDTLNVHAELVDREAVFSADYAFTDYIYSSSGDLNQEFFRIRDYHITNWEQSPVLIVHKIRDLTGENHQLIVEIGCQTVTEAQQYVPLGFVLRCFFSRRGWEYSLGEMRLFVEEIEGLPSSIEVIAPIRDDILTLFKVLNVKEVLSDSVAEWFYKKKLANLMPDI